MKNFTLIGLLYFLLPPSITAQTKPIHEGKFISIGGIEQWITINGNDSSKPVILFLHGGPGSTMSPCDNTIYGTWEKDFILVQWDQRGAGRTFGKNVPAKLNEAYWIENPLTVEQMTADGIALSKYLIKYLKKQKIIILGTSWGSILATEMALKDPVLFYA
jgi:pimeloyl-ACP methyl ester carboxylesterase